MGPLPVRVYVAPGRQAEVLWRLCAGANLGSGLNTQGMFWEDLQPSTVAFHVLLHSYGSTTTNTTIDPLSHSHRLLPSAFLFSLSLLGSLCGSVCVCAHMLCQPGWKLLCKVVTGFHDVVLEVSMCKCASAGRWFLHCIFWWSLSYGDFHFLGNSKWRLSAGGAKSVFFSLLDWHLFNSYSKSVHHVLQQIQQILVHKQNREQQLHYK